MFILSLSLFIWLFEWCRYSLLRAVVCGTRYTKSVAQFGPELYEKAPKCNRRKRMARSHQLVKKKKNYLLSETFQKLTAVTNIISLAEGGLPRKKSRLSFAL